MSISNKKITIENLIGSSVLFILLFIPSIIQIKTDIDYCNEFNNYPYMVNNVSMTSFEKFMAWNCHDCYNAYFMVSCNDLIKDLETGYCKGNNEHTCSASSRRKRRSTKEYVWYYNGTRIVSKYDKYNKYNNNPLCNTSNFTAYDIAVNISYEKNQHNWNMTLDLSCDNINDAEVCKNNTLQRFQIGNIIELVTNKNTGQVYPYGHKCSMTKWSIVLIIISIIPFIIIICSICQLYDERKTIPITPDNNIVVSTPNRNINI